MLESIKSHFDGSGRPPRDIQLEVLDWIARHWDTKPLVLQLPTGAGKSAVARAVQIATGGAIIVPQNTLLDQYADTYPAVNILKGKDRYDNEIEYAQARALIKTGAPTVYNPLSYYYCKTSSASMVIDEAHKLPGMLELLCGVELGKMRWKYPSTDPIELVSWLLTVAEHSEGMGRAYKRVEDFKNSVKYFALADKFKRLSKRLAMRDSNYIVYEEERASDKFLVIKPIRVPANFFKMARESPKTVLMSATIPRRIAETILGSSNFEYLDLKSPIPKEQRQILFRPQGLSSKSEPEEVANWVKVQLAEFEGPTILHVTYKMGKALSRYFPDAHLHTLDTKASTLKAFKKTGGLWIAAGCAEGIDLAGDYARLNLVPIVSFANLGDPLVKARMAQPGGQVDYMMDAIITLIQQIGRSTRGSDDYSVSVCGDNRLAWLIAKLPNQLPKSFLEAIKWNGKLGT